MTKIPLVKLNNGLEIPQLGLGTWKMTEGGEVEQAVLTALDSGYRAIDTAAVYGNEAGVGRALKDSGMPREKIFITTKLWNADQGYDSAKKAFHASLSKLQTDYIDLYLIHWPLGQSSIDSWRALEDLYESGLVKAIGVSNFESADLDKLLSTSKIIPVVNQIELHPRLTQKKVRKYCKSKNIQIESWSPLMQGGKSLQHKVLLQLAEKYGKTPAQIVLRWHIQNGLVVIPKSATPKRIKENSQIFDFNLTEKDLREITKLDDDNRIGPASGSI